MTVEITGPAIPRFPRRAMSAFAGEVVRAIVRARSASFRPDAVSVALVDDRTMAGLNARYRGKRKTTDVLTFEGGEETPEGRSLGEIVISLDRARRQARNEGHSLATEVRYLLVHGILHAFGFDHETDGGEMDALELRIRRRVGLE